MATFTQISLDEMDAQLPGWNRTLEGAYKKEWVYTRPLTAKVDIKVWSSLGKDGKARKKGSDAIRVCATLTKANGQTVGYIKSQRVHRVEGWRDNLMARIDTVTEEAEKRIAEFKAKYGNKPKKTNDKFPALEVPAMPADITTKKDRVQWVRDRIADNVAMAYDVLITIYEMQTAEEQASEMTIEHNGVGFSGTDAEFLSSLAAQLLKKRAKFGNKAYLSAKQTACVQKIVTKYAAQYVRLTEVPGADEEPDGEIDLVTPKPFSDDWQKRNGNAA